MIKGELFRFCFVGAAATITHLVAAALLLSLLPAFNLVAINTAAFFVAFTVSYLGHRHYTFSREGSPFRFFLTSVVGLLINNTVVVVVNSFTGAHFIAIVIGTSIAPVAVFFLSKYWAFEGR